MFNVILIIIWCAKLRKKKATANIHSLLRAGLVFAGIIGRYIKYLPQGRLIPDGMLLHRAFDLYGVNFWGFVNRVPKFSRHYDSPIYELSGGEARLAELYLVLLSDGPFYILDEPFTQVDPLISKKSEHSSGSAARTTASSSPTITTTPFPPWRTICS